MDLDSSNRSSSSSSSSDSNATPTNLSPVETGSAVEQFRVDHLRQLLRKIRDRKELEKNKIAAVEKRLSHGNIVLTVLLGVQLALSASQTTVFADVDKRIVGGLSLASTLTSLALGCVSKRVSSQRGMQKKLLLSQQRWDKAEDAFTMELGACMHDGVLTSEEHLKLKGIWIGLDWIFIYSGDYNRQLPNNNRPTRGKDAKRYE